MDQVFDLYIDSRNNLNTSIIDINLPDNFLCDFKKTDNHKYEWFITFDKISIMNSLSTISKNINDTIVIFDEKPLTVNTNTQDFIDNLLLKTEIPIDLQDIDDRYDTTVITLDEGNPNYQYLETDFNTKCTSLGIGLVISFNEDTSRFTIVMASSSVNKRYIYFGNASPLFGFNKYKVYDIQGVSSLVLISDRNINLYNDNLFNIELSKNSDFELVNKSYCNYNSINILHSDICFQLLLNVLPYDTFLYQRTTENLIPIRLKKNIIKQFTFLITNQDRQLVSNDNGASGACQINLKIIKKPIRIDYNQQIVEYLKLIYLWIASYFKNKI